MRAPGGHRSWPPRPMPSVCVTAKFSRARRPSRRVAVRRRLRVRVRVAIGCLSGLALGSAPRVRATRASRARLLRVWQSGVYRKRRKFSVRRPMSSFGKLKWMLRRRDRPSQTLAAPDPGCSKNGWSSVPIFEGTSFYNSASVGSIWSPHHRWRGLSTKGIRRILQPTRASSLGPQVFLGRICNPLSSLRDLRGGGGRSIGTGGPSSWKGHCVRHSTPLVVVAPVELQLWGA